MAIKKQLPNENCYTQEQVNIITNSQRLWTEASFTLRSLMFSVMRDPDRIQAAADQLYDFVLSNFYEILRFYYGSDIAQQFQNLMSSYFSALWRMYDGLAQNNTEEVNTSTTDLYQVADQISSFLQGINYYWSKTQWQNFLFHHTELKIDQALALAQKDFEKEYQIYRQIRDSSNLMGDYMARGLIAIMATSPRQNQQ
jgi:hypothetical protein